MKFRNLLPVLALLFSLLACNAPGLTGAGTGSEATLAPGTDGGGSSELPTLQPTLAPILTALPPLPTNTLLPTLTATPSVPSVQAGAQDVNCRYGPDTTYLAVGYLLRGYLTPILGKSENGTWWYIQDPRQPGIYCFVSRSVTDTVGNISAIPTIPTPSTRVINVTVLVTLPSSPTPCLGGWPITAGFDGTIETNGPAVVTYRWELSTGAVSGNINRTFNAFGSQNVTESQHLGAQGSYWVRLHVLTPNDITVQGDYTVPCTP